MIWPDLVSSTAPTLNLEYGATAPSRALAAARINCDLFIFTIFLRKIFQQRRRAFLRARPFQNFCVRQFFFADARREICDAGNSATFNPHCRATIASGTVLIPTASAPSRANARISAGVS